jgi:hypothetical protein
MNRNDIKKAIENSYKYTSAGFLIDHDILADKILALSQPKEEPKKDVDLEELREEWNKLTRIKHHITADETFNFFLPHLQKHVESDAVEFAEWFEKTGWIKCSDNGMYYSTNFTEYFGKYIINELYEQFRQLKK